MSGGNTFWSLQFPAGARRRAFTLIELLAVVSVIAILVAIMVSALQKAKERAREVVCRSNLRNVGVGLTLYLQDNDHKPANSWATNGFFWYDDAGKLRRSQDGSAYWGVAYADYIRDTKVFGCLFGKKPSKQQ